MKRIVLLAAMLAVTGTVQAKPAFTGNNYSGVYNCKGANDQVGDYEVTVTLRLNRASSYGKFGAYEYQTETVNSTVYRGLAAARGNQISISFEFNDRGVVEHSIGVATMQKTRGLWNFRKYYYEPDANGGNYGNEYCIIDRAKTAKKFAL